MGRPEEGIEEGMDGRSHAGPRRPSTGKKGVNGRSSGDDCGQKIAYLWIMRHLQRLLRAGGEGG